MALWQSFSSSTVKQTLGFLSQIDCGSGTPVGIVWAEVVVLGVGSCALALPAGRAICAGSCLGLKNRQFVQKVLPFWSRTIYSLSFFSFEMTSPSIVQHLVWLSWMNTFVPGGSNGSGVCCRCMFCLLQLLLNSCLVLWQVQMMWCWDSVTNLMSKHQLSRT
jgi:hypothetical protein